MDLNYKPPYNYEEGTLLLFDKPLQWTSFGLVKKVRKLVQNKVGHAGTLDPLATGLMILGVGKFTKKLESLQGLDKSYSGTIKLGVTTPSFDAETKEENPKDFSHIANEEIEQLALKFIGDHAQIPPMYSAVKRDGKKLYEYARKGRTVLRGPRPITIFEFEITGIELPFVHFHISCSKGTYIRSIAKDFGDELGVGGYLTALKRTKIGDYTIEDAWDLDDFIQFIEENNVNEDL